MFKVVRIAAVIGAIAYLSPERDREAPISSLPGSAVDAEALLRGLPDSVRDRLAAEALRRSAEAVNRNLSGQDGARPPPALR